MLASAGADDDSAVPAAVVDVAVPKDPKADTPRLALYGHPLAGGAGGR